jgi:hypothetical protein
MAAPYYIYGGNLLNREKYTSVVNTTYGTRRYFSSIDTDVYFGNTLIDEMVAFDFIIDEKKIPIYGYNNFTPKRIITGQKTIQGSFAINFTQTFNLKLIIDGLDDSIYHNKYEETQFFCGEDNQALFGKGFDITLSYGDAKGEGSYNACTQTLVGCYITSYRQAFDTSGEPILDMYTFTAKDLILNTDLSMESPAAEEEKETNNDTTTEPISFEHYEVSDDYEHLVSFNTENPDTLCIWVNPEYNYDFDGVQAISAMVMPINEGVELEDVTVKIEITDIGYDHSIKTFDLTKVSTTPNMYDKKLKGTEVQAGKVIRKLFGEDTNGIKCNAHITWKYGDKTEEVEQLVLLREGAVAFE